VTEHLRAHRSVLIVGPSMVGETSLAATVVREAYPDHVILIPNTASALVDLDKADITPPNQMIWLDDLKQFLGKAMKDSSLVEYLEMAKVVETVTEVDDKFRGIIRPAVFPRLPEAEWWNLGVDGKGGLSDVCRSAFSRGTGCVVCGRLRVGWSNRFMMSSRSMKRIWLRFDWSSLLPSQLRAPAW
jgi:hypothetical protein